MLNNTKLNILGGHLQNKDFHERRQDFFNLCDLTNELDGNLHLYSQSLDYFLSENTKLFNTFEKIFDKESLIHDQVKQVSQTFQRLSEETTESRQDLNSKIITQIENYNKFYSSFLDRLQLRETVEDYINKESEEQKDPELNTVNQKKIPIVRRRRRASEGTIVPSIKSSKSQKVQRTKGRKKKNNNKKSTLESMKKNQKKLDKEISKDLGSFLENRHNFLNAPYCQFEKNRQQIFNKFDSLLSELEGFAKDKNKFKLTEPIEGDEVSFEEMMEDPYRRFYFRHFLEAEFATENLDFFQEVEKYREITSEEERVKVADRIFKIYVQSGTEAEINIEYIDRENIEKDLKKGADIDVFDKAGKHIHFLMKNNSYPRFLKSKFFQKLLWKCQSRDFHSGIPIHDVNQDDDTSFLNSSSEDEFSTDSDFHDQLSDFDDPIIPDIEKEEKKSGKKKVFVFETPGFERIKKKRNSVIDQFN
ncbi:regulator of g protein signaling [Anaeramoeba flamelloides]|uniref:Regulator of g protein signaling n=1 Tax=Anaeramoeba flamelloides TaxID=1746091 RepID=A0ABQ8YJR3_9EUKA|nr:regulator of g protein signaling [Anaeramoeba flamelloides]